MVKKTRQKELILKVLRSNPFHPSAVWIYDRVREEMPNLSLATVYRVLKQFLEQGEISELKLDDSLSRFDIRADNHGHFQCDKCKKIFNIDELADRELNGRLSQKTGFQVSNYSLFLRGLCPECQTSHQKIAIA